MEMGELSAEVVESIVAQAEERATLAEVAAADERRKQRDLDRIAKATADADAADAAASAVGDAQAAEGEAAVEETSSTEAVTAEGSQAPSAEPS